jgi:hypothetical protein
MQATVNPTVKLYRLYGYCNVKRILILTKEAEEARAVRREERM